MSREISIILNIYSIAIILIIYFHALKFFEKDSLPDKLYMLILYITILMLGVDILSRFDGNTAIIYLVFNAVGNFVIFLMSPVLPSLWVAYVHFQVFREERKTRRLFYPLCIINAINAIILIFSQFFGWFYYIDSGNIYHRGPLFLFPAFITIMLMLVAFTLTVINRRNLEKKSFLSLIFFAIPPFISIILQIAFYGISLMLNSVVLSLLVVFLNIQNHSMYTDHLTGVNNRKKLDAYLKEKVSLSTGEKGFSAILIDINNFKYINDTYGHDIGDNALETVAKLLKSCIRTNDFIARFGGDEFCIVLDISNISDLEAMVCRINNCLEKYNKSGTHLYELGFSMGYAVYAYHLHKSAEEFLKQVDILMYESKQAYKNKLSM
jgi:diguanylate cyclase (GGDEF)-like protein